MTKKEETNLTKDHTNPCSGCIKCCLYVAIELDAPEDDDDYQNIRWYVAHKNVWIFIDHDDSWNVQFNTPCEKLDPKGWCNIYEKRPKICREYTTDGCEKYGEGNTYKILFKNLEEFDEWIANGKKIPKE